MRSIGMVPSSHFLDQPAYTLDTIPQRSPFQAGERRRGRRRPIRIGKKFRTISQVNGIVTGN